MRRLNCGSRAHDNGHYRQLQPGRAGEPLLYVRCHASFLSLSCFRNSSEYFPFGRTRRPEPGIQKLLGHDGTGTVRSPSSFADQIDNAQRAPAFAVGPA